MLQIGPLEVEIEKGVADVQNTSTVIESSEKKEVSTAETELKATARVRKKEPKGSELRSRSWWM